jgi:hypothetical protein
MHEVREFVESLTGMWSPDANEGDLREAARAWRAFAEDVDDVAAATYSRARALVDNNRGESIEAFDEFWRRYYHSGRGWLKDLSDAARGMAKGLDEYADAVHEANQHIDHELEIQAAVLAAGVGLAVFTFGASAAAAEAAAWSIAGIAADLGVSVSSEVAAIAGTTLSGVVFGGLESVTVDLAVAQPARIALCDQQGLNLDEAKNAAVLGAVIGGAFGGGAGAYQAVKDAGGLRAALDGVSIGSVNQPQLAFPGGSLPGAGAGSGLDQHWLFAWKDLPQEVKDNWFRGNKFNRDNHTRYPANEVHLANGKRLDSYTPGEEIVSRKHTQLSEIEPRTAHGYLDEIVSKYEPDTVIRSNKYPDLDGKVLQGDMILEVPVQDSPVPANIIEHAQELDIAIRDVTGHVYT